MTLTFVFDQKLFTDLEYDHLDYTRPGTSFKPHYHRMTDDVVIPKENNLKENNTLPGNNLKNNNNNDMNDLDRI